MSGQEDSTSKVPPKVEDEIYDLLGIGFGPANMALAISFTESEEAKRRGLKYSFIERQATFAWHPTLLLPGAQLQVSPFKDLATMRDPTSTFTFVNYLHKVGRLSASINREANIPSRREWSAYLTWCASRLTHLVNYGEQVLSIEPISNSGGNKSCIDHANSQATAAPADASVRLLRVTSRLRSGQIVVRLTRNITVGVGGRPTVPQQFSHIFPASPWDTASRVVHSSTFLPCLNAIEPELSAVVERRIGRSSPASKTNWPLKFAIIGAGQSSAEMALHLRRTFPAASVKMVFRASTLVPSDDSAFVNSVAFDPERTDAYWAAGEKERKEWRQEFKRTNYSVVRSDVLNELSEQIYNQKIELPQLFPGSDGPAEGRLEIMANTYVESAELINEGAEEQVRMVMKSTKLNEPQEVEDFDAVFLGTGFERRPASFDFMKPLQPHLPILSEPETNAKKRAALGFSDDDDSRTMTGDDDVAKEMVRQRTRGITRDYRLVAWESDPYKTKPVTDSPLSAQLALSRRNSEFSEVTLAQAADDEALEAGPRFEPNIYSFGGNEVTHGLSDSLLSICAWRAGEVTESILNRIGTQRAPTKEDMMHSHDVTGKTTSGTGSDKMPETDVEAAQWLGVAHTGEKTKTDSLLDATRDRLAQVSM